MSRGLRACRGLRPEPQCRQRAGSVVLDQHIRIGDEVMECTGIRTHMKSTGEIESFRLLPELRFDPIDQRHLLVGVVGDAREEPGFDRILKIVG